VFKIKKRSGWSLDNDGGASAGFGFVTAGAGTFVLKSPDGGTTQFNHMSGGVSVSLGKMKFDAQASPYEFPSRGQVYVLSTFSKPELSAEDFEGFCLIEELGVGAGGGGSVAWMLLGIPAAAMPAEIVKSMGAIGKGLRVAAAYPDVTKALLGPIGGLIFDEVKDRLDQAVASSAKALLVVRGLNAGPQLTAGISGSLGYVSIGKKKPAPPPKPPGPKPILVREITINELIIHVPGDVLFDFDKSDLKQQARDALEQVVKLIQTRSPRRISIEGHTDSIGGQRYNLGLSNRRAQSVAQWLISRRVVNVSSLTTKGWGESRPVKPNTKPDGSDDRDARAMNRRVEIYLIK
jgi:photosystem I P700 chlorophyll a apoprotein A2